jgi:hypothetical protein
MLIRAPQYKDTMPSVLRRLVSQLSLSIEEIKQFDNSPTHECYATLFKGLLCQPFCELVCELVDTRNRLNGDISRLIILVRNQWKGTPICLVRGESLGICANLRHASLSSYTKDGGIMSSPPSTYLKALE